MPRSPGAHEGLLHGLLGQAAVPERPSCETEELPAVRDERRVAARLRQRPLRATPSASRLFALAVERRETVGFRGGSIRVAPAGGGGRRTGGGRTVLDASDGPGFIANQIPSTPWPFAWPDAESAA